MENSFFSRFQELCRQAGKSPNGVAAELGIPSGSVTAWKRGAAPRSATVIRIAQYFDTTADYLCGKEAPERPTPMTKEDIKFALFGGDGEISDDMLDEVFQFAQFIKQRSQKKE